MNRRHKGESSNENGTRPDRCRHSGYDRYRNRDERCSRYQHHGVEQSDDQYAGSHYTAGFGCRLRVGHHITGDGQQGQGTVIKTASLGERGEKV